MKRSPKAPPAPSVRTFGPDTAIGKLGAAYSEAIDRAVAAETEVKRLIKADKPRGQAFEEGKWRVAMDAFDKAEEALSEAMQAAGLRAVIVGNRLFMDLQSEEEHIPDRPQTVTYQTFRTD